MKHILLTIAAIYLGLFLAHGQSSGKMLRWDFPLPRTHTGVLMGNGTQGLMVWGGGRQLNITLGRAGFWDHRGGNDFSARTNFNEVKRLLQQGDEVGLRKAFDMDDSKDYVVHRPHQVGGGRMEILLPEGWMLSHAFLNLQQGRLTIHTIHSDGKIDSLILWQSAYTEHAFLEFPPTFSKTSAFSLVPSWAHTRETLEKIGVSPPTELKGPIQSGIAFEQSLPEDLPLGIGARMHGNRLVIATYLGKNALHQVAKAVALDNSAILRPPTVQYWREYHQQTPSLQLPDPKIQELFDYGLYKQAITTSPQGLAAGLQGPFLEEYQLPPWSSDFHFNVNIEMIYWPALATNRTSHLVPLWRMFREWLPSMQATGEKFFGRPGALMIPHAVDDRLQVVGSFWTGTIDHACTAWMAQLAWLDFRYSQDTAILRELAWPLLHGAFEGYWAMIEPVTDADGKNAFRLPVSVSPEFKGARMDAWGANASFQLAACHLVARCLQQAARVMGRQADPRWQEIQDKLPLYSVFKGPRTLEYPESESSRIALWDGMDLVESHRHHSHLAGIYPFAIIDSRDTTHKAIISNSLWHLTHKGAGAWSGWCVPWAATLFARNNNADAAVAWLHYFADHYTNEGRGTLHNARHTGLSVIADQPWEKVTNRPNREIMQLDGGFGAVSAVLEILVQNRYDGIHLLPDRPLGWERFSFERIGAEGAFQISAWVEEGKIQKIKVKSLSGGPLKLWHSLGESFLLDGLQQSGKVLEMNCTKGQELVLTRIR